VADRHLVEMRQPMEHRQVAEIEIVTRVDAQALGVRDEGGRDVLLERARCGCGTAFERAREGFGVELHSIGAEPSSPPNRLGVGIHEHAHAHAGVLHPRHGRGQVGLGCRRRPAGLTRDLAGHDRDERALIRLDGQDHLDEIRPGVTLDVELDSTPERRQLVSDLEDVAPADVPLVGARMHGNARSAGVDAHPDRLDDGRDVAAA
jgi:hypothetical protein